MSHFRASVGILATVALLSATLLSATLTACGGREGDAGASASEGGAGNSAGGMGSSAPALPIENLAPTLAQKLCQGLAICCRTAGLAVESLGCAWKVQEQFQFPTGPTVAYVPKLGGQCAVEVYEAISGCYSIDDIPACESMFTGTVALGGACASSRDCVQPESGRATCSVAQNGTPWCALEPAEVRGLLGVGCSQTCYEEADGAVGCSMLGAAGSSAPPSGAATCYVSDGLYCASNSWTCQPLVALGGYCDYSSACVESARCDAVAQRCVEKGSEGSPCTGSTDCAADTFCSTGVCLRKKADGEPCAQYDECIGYCLSVDGIGGTCASGRRRVVPTSNLCQDYELG